MNPLDQLADISTPSEVSVWPLAWGYWLAIALVLMLIVATASLVLRHLKRTQQKRNALAQLNALDCSDTQYIPKVQLLLKQVCSVYFPSHKIKTMHGSAWQQFLLSVYAGSNGEQIEQAATDINQYLYTAKPNNTGAQAQISAEDNQKHLHLKTALVDFIKSSLPPSKATNNKLANSKNINKPDADASGQGSGNKQEKDLAHV